MRYLTKTRFTLALQCPTKLDYSDDRDYANADITNEFLSALAEGGHQVGAFAKCLFPHGIEIDAVGHDAQVEQTDLALQRDNVTIFEAAVRVDRLFIRADVLRRSGKQFDLFEVKAKGIDPGDPQILGKRGGFLAGMKPYLYDVAFQRHVLRRAFPEAEIRSHLVMLDKTAICDEPGLAQRLQIVKVDGYVRVAIDPSLRDGRLASELLHVLPVDDYLDQLEALPLAMGGWEFSFSEGIDELARRLGDDPFPPRLGNFCKNCQFHAAPAELLAGKRDGRFECIERATGIAPVRARQGTVFELYQSRATNALLAEGKVLLVDLEPEDVKLVEKANGIALCHRQWLQSEESRGALKDTFLCVDQLREQFDRLKFPLHFIDFETSRPPLPFHAGFGPYGQLLFQFSHHRVDMRGSFGHGTLRHATQYLSDTLAEPPNFGTLRALREALISDQGSVVHWWDHERTVLKEIRAQLQTAPAGQLADREQLIAFIDDMLGTDAKPGRLFDLGRLIHDNAFFLSTHGSSSLKKVLPALLSTSHYLQERYSAHIYGSKNGIPSLNFTDHAWVQHDDVGAVVDPYLLLGERSDDPDLSGLDNLEEDGVTVADGGAAMVAYGLLQNGQLDAAATQELRAQLLRYCELDTLAMVFAWEGICDLLRRRF